MAEIIRPDFGKKSNKKNEIEQKTAGQVVPLGHIDLPTVVGTISLLRSLEDQSFLDCYNNRDWHNKKQDLRKIS